MELDQDQPSRIALGRTAVLRDRVVPRALLTIGVVTFFVAGYFGVGWNVDPAKARDLGTALDHRIPFIPASVWVYLWLFPASLLPLFLVRCPRLFRRTLLAYGIAIAVSFLAFVVFPVTSDALRVDRATLDVTHVSAWAVALLYRLDPPVNLFPSLHLSIATLAALAARKARRSYGAAAAVGVLLVGVSICTVKQHFVLDGLGGAALAAAVYAFVLRSYVPAKGSDPAYGWRGPATFLALVLAVYASFFIGFLASS